jgi:hypothetical protein
LAGGFFHPFRVIDVTKEMHGKLRVPASDRRYADRYAEPLPLTSGGGSVHLKRVDALPLLGRLADEADISAHGSAFGIATVNQLGTLLADGFLFLMPENGLCLL